MAWTFDWGDSFLTYSAADITTHGHWSSIVGGFVSDATIAEDGLHGLLMNDVRRTMPASTLGRMLVARLVPNAFTNGESGVLALLTTGVGLVFSIGRDETSTGLKLYLPNGTSITSADPNALCPTGQAVNIGLCGITDGVNMHYAVRVNNVAIGDLTGSAAYATTRVLDIVSPSRGSGSGICLSTYAWMLSKVYSGSGGMPASADWFGNLKRGAARPDEEGQYPAVQAGARWIPSTGTKYFQVLDETLTDTTDYASNIVDANGAPGAVDRMSVRLSDPPTTLVNVGAVQRRTVMRMQSGSGTAKLFYGVTGAAGDTYDATNVAVASSYNAELRPLLVDPRDAAAWNRAKLVNLDLGVECFDLT